MDVTFTAAGYGLENPLKRLIESEEVPELVIWLCRGACAFNAGAVSELSGGRLRIDAVKCFIRRWRA